MKTGGCIPQEEMISLGNLISSFFRLRYFVRQCLVNANYIYLSASLCDRFFSLLLLSSIYYKPPNPVLSLLPLKHLFRIRTTFISVWVMYCDRCLAALQTLKFKVKTLSLEWSDSHLTKNLTPQSLKKKKKRFLFKLINHTY